MSSPRAGSGTTYMQTPCLAVINESTTRQEVSSKILIVLLHIILTLMYQQSLPISSSTLGH